MPPREASQRVLQTVTTGAERNRAVAAVRMDPCSGARGPLLYKQNQAKILFSLHATCTSHIWFFLGGDFPSILYQVYSISQPTQWSFTKNLIGVHEWMWSAQTEISTRKVVCDLKHMGRLSHDPSKDQRVCSSGELMVQLCTDPWNPPSWWKHLTSALSNALSTGSVLGTWGAVTSTNEMTFYISIYFTFM